MVGAPWIELISGFIGLLVFFLLKCFLPIWGGHKVTFSSQPDWSQ
jgi:hypothetical protein